MLPAYQPRQWRDRATRKRLLQCATENHHCTRTPRLLSRSAHLDVHAVWCSRNIGSQNICITLAWRHCRCHDDALFECARKTRGYGRLSFLWCPVEALMHRAQD